MKTDIKKILQAFPLILVTLAAPMTFVACSDGPVEEATEDMGDTAEDVGESVDNALGN